MPLSPSQVILYAADSADYRNALGATAIAGIPTDNVTGDFYSAWSYTASGDFLVIAVGGAAADSLYYNACGWTNPAGTPGGGTPFSAASGPVDTLPAAHHYLAAAGSTGSDTLYLAAAYAYFAVHGACPATFPAPPGEVARVSHCFGQARLSCPCRSSHPTWSCGSADYARGIDVSPNNDRATTTATFWTQAQKEGVTFAIIKATEGANYVSPDLPAQYGSSVQALGTDNVGLYHFLDWQYSGREQARLFHQAVSTLSPVPDPLSGLGLWLDVEEPNGNSSTGQPSITVVNEFIATLADLFHTSQERVPGIYTNQDTWVNLLGDPQSFSRHPLWLAAPNGVSTCPGAFGGWEDWTLLQYSFDGTVDSRAGFDMDQRR